MQIEVTSLRNHKSVAFVVLGKPRNEFEFEFFYKPGPLSSSEKIFVSLMAYENTASDEKVNFCKYLQGCFLQYIRRGIEEKMDRLDIETELDSDYKYLHQARSTMGYMSIGNVEFEVLAEEVIFNAKSGGWVIKNNASEIEQLIKQHGCLSKFVYYKK